MEQHLCRVEWRKSLANLGSTVLSTVANNNSNDRTNNDEEGTIQVEIDLYSLASPEQTNPMLFSGVLHDSFGETPGPLQGVADPSTFYNVVDSLSLYERGARVPSPATRLRMNPTISASGARRQRAPDTFRLSNRTPSSVQSSPTSRAPRATTSVPVRHLPTPNTMPIPSSAGPLGFNSPLKLSPLRTKGSSQQNFSFMANHSFLQSDDSSHLALQHLSTGATSPDPSCSLSHSRGNLLPDATLISVTTGRALPSYNSHTRNPAELHEEGCITLASQSTSQLELNRRLSHHSPLDKLAILSSNPRKGATESPNSPNHYLPSPRRRRPVGPNLSPNTANDAFPVGSYPSLTALEVDCTMVPSEGKRKEGRTRGRMNFSPRTASPNTGMSQLE